MVGSMIRDQKKRIDVMITMQVSSATVILSRREIAADGRKRIPIMNRGKVMRLGMSARDGKGLFI